MYYLKGGGLEVNCGSVETVCYQSEYYERHDRHRPCGEKEKLSVFATRDVLAGILGYLV